MIYDGKRQGFAEGNTKFSPRIKLYDATDKCHRIVEMEKTVQSCPNAGFDDTAVKNRGLSIDLLDRGVVGKAVEEFKRAEARLTESGVVMAGGMSAATDGERTFKKPF